MSCKVSQGWTVDADVGGRAAGQDERFWAEERSRSRPRNLSIGVEERSGAGEEQEEENISKCRRIKVSNNKRRL